MIIKFFFDSIVTIQVVDYKVKAKTIYISKYYIINKQPRETTA